MLNSYHTTVLLKEAVDALDIKPGGVYVDCTFGGGGHSREILKRLSSKGRLVAFDQDEDAQQNLMADDRVIFVPHNFKHLQRFLKLHKLEKVDGILADLGVSSYQFDEAARGFSIRFDAALDMRMDRREGNTAADVLNTYTEARLHKMFELYGEVTNSKTLASTIVKHREHTGFSSIEKFRQAIHPIVKGNPHKYFAQVFQALRIEVNDEMGALEQLLMQAAASLAKGGKLSVITFHSLEDRLVKNFIRYGSGVVPAADEIFGTKPLSPLKAINKKPILPSAEEQKNNPRSRSAKLRIAEKV